MTTRAPAVPIKKLFWKRLSHSNRIILISTERTGIWNTISFSWNASSICSNGRYCHPILFVFASSPFHMCPIITFLFLFSRRVQHFHINLSKMLWFLAALAALYLIQGCINCAILLSRIGACGVSSEHMENMEMFSCSPRATLSHKLTFVDV